MPDEMKRISALDKVAGVLGANRAVARVAIEALRDPSDTILLAAGEPYGGKIDRSAGLQARRTAWNKMLDAILSEVA